MLNRASVLEGLDMRELIPTHAAVRACIKDGDYPVITTANFSVKNFGFSNFISIRYRDFDADVWYFRYRRTDVAAPAVPLTPATFE